jgi:hypothetical protein
MLVAPSVGHGGSQSTDAQTEVAHPVPNCLRMPTAGGQWLKGEKWDFEKFLVSNKYVPGAEITRRIQGIQYSG